MKTQTTKAKKPSTYRRRPRVDAQPLRFTPTAWAKLLFLRDCGDSEVGGFGIAASDDLLLVEDVRLVRQSCTWAHVAFDDESVADLFDEQVDAGRRPEQFARIWVHTHPGDCPLPSLTDEQTFARVFGRCQWAVMFILAREGRSYARLRMNVGPGAEVKLPVSVDYTRLFGAYDRAVWEQEYLANVRVQQPFAAAATGPEPAFGSPHDDELRGEAWQERWFESFDEQFNPGAFR